MFLAVDAGNSNIVLGVFDGDQWIHQWRMETDGFRKSTQIDDEVINALEHIAVDDVMISSVVPEITKALAAAIKNATSVIPTVLNAFLETGIELATDNPEEVGTDLIANAVGAYHHFQEHCIVVDFGTATTIMVVKEPGVLAGGAICAGLETTVEALVGKAAQLGAFPIDFPPKTIGNSTVEAMQSGLVLGHLAMVEGLVQRMKQESGAEKVMATGGLSTLLAGDTDIFDEVDSLLTLEGLRLISEREEGNRQK